VTTSFFAAAGAAAAGRRSALFKLLHAEADAFLVDIDVEHDGRNLLALAVQRQRVLARDAPGDVRHVDHAVDVAVEADEQAELGRVLDFAFDGRTDRVLLGEGFPGVLLGLLEAEADAALVAVDFEHHDVDFLRGRDDLAGVDVLLGPGHFRNVDQAFDARLQLHEGAVFGDVGDGAAQLGADRVLGGDAFPRIASSCFMPRLMRWVSWLMRTICTFTVSPMLITSFGWLTRL
jgi:hypothetical protein